MSNYLKKSLFTLLIFAVSYINSAKAMEYIADMDIADHETHAKRSHINMADISQTQSSETDIGGAQWRMEITDEDYPDELLCPITREPMKNPVNIPDGWAYEREKIEEWFNKRRSSPKTNEDLENLILIPNNNIRMLTEGWKDTIYNIVKNKVSAGYKDIIENITSYKLNDRLKLFRNNYLFINKKHFFAGTFVLSSTTLYIISNILNANSYQICTPGNMSITLQNCTTTPGRFWGSNTVCENVQLPVCEVAQLQLVEMLIKTLNPF